MDTGQYAASGRIVCPAISLSFVGRGGFGGRKNFGKFDVWVVTLQSLLLGGGRFG